MKRSEKSLRSVGLCKTLIAGAAVFLPLMIGFGDEANALEENEKAVSSPFSTTTTVEGRNGFRPHVGVAAGIANPEGNYETAPELGIDVGYQPFVPFGLGASITTSRNESKNSSHDLERMSILVRGTYNFGGSMPVIRNSWAGVAAGPVFSHDGTDLGFAPMIGFDVPIREEVVGSFLSLGADVRYLVVTGDAADTFSMNAVIKYWF